MDFYNWTLISLYFDEMAWKEDAGENMVHP